MTLLRRAGHLLAGDRRKVAALAYSEIIVKAHF
jgi:hypothetical protein